MHRVKKGKLKYFQEKLGDNRSIKHTLLYKHRYKNIYISSRIKTIHLRNSLKAVHIKPEDL